MAKQSKTDTIEVKPPSENKIFIPEENSVTTLSGETFKIPKLSWKKELQLLDIVQEAIQSLVDNDTPIDGGVDNVVVKALRIVPEKITKFMALVLDRETDWVENNLDSPEILGVIVPLLKGRFDLIQDRLQKFIPEGAKDPLSTLKSAVSTQAIQ